MNSTSNRIIDSLCMKHTHNVEYSPALDTAVWRKTLSAFNLLLAPIVLWNATMLGWVYGCRGLLR